MDRIMPKRNSVGVTAPNIPTLEAETVLKNATGVDPEKNGEGETPSSIFGDVNLGSLQPMSNDGKNGGAITSTCSQRTRKQMDAYAPSMQFFMITDKMGPLGNAKNAEGGGPWGGPSAEKPTRVGAVDASVGNPPKMKHRLAGQRGRSNSKRECALRAWKMRHKKKVITPINNDDAEQLKERGDGLVSPSKNEEELSNQGRDEDPQEFREGQNVWVSIGKATHDAVVISVQNPAKGDGPKTAWVRWPTMGTIDEVEVNQLAPMFPEENDKSVPSSFRKRERKKTERYMPPPQPLKKAKVQETWKASKHGKAVKASIDPGAMRKDKVKAGGSDLIRQNLDTIKQVPSGVTPGPDWKQIMVAVGQNGSLAKRWMSPCLEILFRIPRAAFEFEGIRQQCNGDESQALETYLGHRQAAGKESYITNLKQIRTATQRNSTEKASKLSRMPSMETQSNQKAEDNTESWDAAENMTLVDICSRRRQAAGKDLSAKKWKRQPRATKGKAAKKAPKLCRIASVETQSNSKADENTKSFDKAENMTLAEIRSRSSQANQKEAKEKTESLDEIEYKFLCDYYLKPITRENEELPGGMVLRKKQAACNLLRSKNLVFRQKLYRKILFLERLGRKHDIHRLLKALHNHDKSMQSGDGPREMLEEILGGKPADDGEVEVLDADAVTALQGHVREGANNTVEDGTNACHPCGLAKKICIVDIASGAFNSEEELADPGQRAKGPKSRRGTGPPSGKDENWKEGEGASELKEVAVGHTNDSGIQNEVVDLLYVELSPQSAETNNRCGTNTNKSNMIAESSQVDSNVKRPPEICVEVIDLCGDGDLGNTHGISGPADSVIRRRVSNRNASLVTDVSAKKGADNQQRIRNNGILGIGSANYSNNAQKGNYNSVDVEKESSKAVNQPTEIIDLSQEEEEELAMNPDGVTIID